MASDKSDPRVGLILQVGVLAIVTLLGTRAFLQAYFDRAERAEITRKLGTPEPLANLRADEAQRLNNGSMPVEKAMQMLVAKGRMNASPDIMPSASKDRAPLEGWSRLPGEVPPAFGQPPPEPAPAPPPSSLAAPPASAAPSPAPSKAPAPGRAPNHP